MSEISLITVPKFPKLRAHAYTRMYMHEIAQITERNRPNYPRTIRFISFNIEEDGFPSTK